MATMRDIKRRVRSVKSIQQITRAMMLISVAKLKRAEAEVIKSRPYTKAIREMALNLAVMAEKGSHPFLIQSDNKESTGLIIVTSQRGLCGGFNSNVNRKALKFLQTTAGGQLITIGSRAQSYFKQYDWGFISNYPMPDPVNYHFSQGIVEQATNLYLSGQLNEVYVVYNQPKTALTQEVVILRLLPIPLTEGSSRIISDYLYEPTMNDVLDALLKEYLTTQIHQILLESQAAEHTARMMAMQQATDNTKKMIKELLLNFNRVRQAGITKEIIEITSTAEAVG